jgi:hypothetical protein
VVLRRDLAGPVGETPRRICEYGLKPFSRRSFRRSMAAFIASAFTSGLLKSWNESRTKG